MVPALIASAPLSPGTCAGVPWSTTDPSPSWPFAFAPQQLTVVSASRAHENLEPEVTDVALVMPETSVGAVLVVVEPMPIWPRSLLPQHVTCRSDMRAQACWEPVAITLGTCAQGVGGGVESTVQAVDAGALLLPAASTALTENVCSPSRIPLRVNGFEHAANAAPSTEQTYVTASPFVKVIVGLATFVDPDGAPESCGATGATVSTVQLIVASPPTLPAASVCLTTTRCDPSASELNVAGFAHAFGAAPSSAQV